jgi:hypothetical protein
MLRPTEIMLCKKIAIDQNTINKINQGASLCYEVCSYYFENLDEVIINMQATPMETLILA